MSKIVIGVDISKKKFDAASLCDGKYKHKTFPNNAQGFTAFLAWLTALSPGCRPLVCMEATGAYSIPLAGFLHAQSHPVSVVNPAKIHAYGKSELRRAKTDKADAKLIARYATDKDLPLWAPPPRNIRELQALLRRAECLMEMAQMERNRLETSDPSVTASIHTVLAALEAELEATRRAIRDHIDNDPELKGRRDLLATIPGIGEASAAHLLVLLSAHHGFTRAKQAAALAGLAPCLRESGQWKGKTKLAKNGECLVRKVLYFPAMSAWTHNPVIRPFCQRLKANGVNGKAIVCAAMRKLVHLAFGVLKSGRPFDPDFAV